MNYRDMPSRITAERVCGTLARWKGRGDVPTRKPPFLPTLLLVSWGMVRKEPDSRGGLSEMTKTPDPPQGTHPGTRTGFCAY